MLRVILRLIPVRVPVPVCAGSVSTGRHYDLVMTHVGIREPLHLTALRTFQCRSSPRMH